jgi:hypothetical protein
MHARRGLLIINHLLTELLLHLGRANRVESLLHVMRLVQILRLH